METTKGVTAPKTLRATDLRFTVLCYKKLAYKKRISLGPWDHTQLLVNATQTLASIFQMETICNRGNA